MRCCNSFHVILLIKKNLLAIPSGRRKLNLPDEFAYPDFSHFRLDMESRYLFQIYKKFFKEYVIELYQISDY